MNYDENNVEPITTPDTSNATKLNASEGEDPQLDKNGDYKWERLSGINTGAVDSFGNRDESTTRIQERKASFDIISDKLHLIDVHQREGRNIMEDVDMEKFAGRKITVNLVSFCIAAHLVNRDNIPRDYHPNRSKERNDRIFMEVGEQFEFEHKIINSVMQKVDEYV